MQRKSFKDPCIIPEIQCIPNTYLEFIYTGKLFYVSYFCILYICIYYPFLIFLIAVDNVRSTFYSWY